MFQCLTKSEYLSISENKVAWKLNLVGHQIT